MYRRRQPKKSFPKLNLKFLMRCSLSPLRYISSQEKFSEIIVSKSSFKNGKESSILRRSGCYYREKGNKERKNCGNQAGGETGKY